MPHKPYKQLRDTLNEALAANPEGGAIRRATKRALEAELAEHDRTLAQVRRARSLTQSQLAAALDVSQAQVSRIETQADLYLSTLASYVTAMGGQLELIATFPEERPTRLLVGEILATIAANPDVDLGVGGIAAATEKAHAAGRKAAASAARGGKPARGKRTTARP